MKNQNSKKQSEKNGKAIQMNQKANQPSKQEVESLERVVMMETSIYNTINAKAEEMKKDGKGEMTVNEIICVMSKMLYSYNARSLSEQHKEVQPKSES